ncbi:hypothetical protein WK81_26985 [Burkholderia ubonensis]|nr:hypothetical protein WK81_26985 [Burkholderia ubonensis]
MLVFKSPFFNLINDNFFLVLRGIDEVADRIAMQLSLLAMQIVGDVIYVPSRMCPAIYDSINCDRGMSKL